MMMSMSTTHPTTTRRPVPTSVEREGDSRTGYQVARRDIDQGEGGHVSAATAWATAHELAASDDTDDQHMAGWWAAYATQVERERPAEFTPQPGDFLVELLVTDTIAYEVVSVTARTITVRRANEGERVASENVGGNPWPVVYAEIVSSAGDPWPVRRLGRRSDGTFRTHRTGNPFRAATVVDGKPVTRTDYRF